MTKVNEVLKERIDIVTASPSMSLLKLQSLIQDGYVIDVGSRTGVRRSGVNHIFVELIKAVPVGESEKVELAVITTQEIDKGEEPKVATPKTSTRKTTTKEKPNE